MSVDSFRTVVVSGRSIKTLCMILSARYLAVQYETQAVLPQSYPVRSAIQISHLVYTVVELREQIAFAQ